MLVRGRVHGVRETSKVLFLTLRQSIATVQCVVLKAANADMFKWVGSLPKETVVDVTGVLSAPEKPILSVTQGDVELTVEKVRPAAAPPSPVPPCQCPAVLTPPAPSPPHSTVPPACLCAFAPSCLPSRVAGCRCS